MEGDIDMLPATPLPYVTSSSPERFTDVEETQYDNFYNLVNDDGLEIHKVPDFLMNESIIWAALTQNYEAIEFIPSYKLDPFMCLYSVQKDPYMLKFVPHELMTAHMISWCIQKDGIYLKFVPKDRHTYDLCIQAIDINPFAFKYVREDLKDYDMCLKMVTLQWGFIAFIPKNKRHVFMSFVPKYILPNNGKIL